MISDTPNFSTSINAVENKTDENNIQNVKLTKNEKKEIKHTKRKEIRKNKRLVDKKRKHEKLNNQFHSDIER